MFSDPSEKKLYRRKVLLTLAFGLTLALIPHYVLSSDFTPSARLSLDGNYDEKFPGRQGINEVDMVRP